MNILDNFKSLHFCFHTLVVRRTIDVLDLKKKTSPEPDPVKSGPDPELHGLKRMSDTKSMKTKKKAFKII